MQKIIDQNESEIKALKAGLLAMEGLINESNGVIGLHLNGDVAIWSELREGGHLEDWLIDFDKALKFI